MGFEAIALREFVNKVWGDPSESTRFPGPQPVSIERQHFPLLKKSDYLVCYKMDGIRKLFACCEIEGVKRAALIDRAYNVEFFTYTLPKDTLLDGELVTRSDGRQVFLIHDAMMIRGESLMQKPLSERLMKARALCRTIMTRAPFTTMVKEMRVLQEIDKLEVPPYATDGLIFTPIREPVQTGTHETMFKWKPRSHITVDFLVQNKVELYIQERGRLIRETVLHFPKEEYTDGTIVECGYGEAGWEVVKVRTDKTYPNNRRTYLRTIVNLREDIKREEFLGIV
jgi:hypothetical protein